MSLNLSKFKTDLKAAMKTAALKNASENDLDAAIGRVANAIATEVDKYILTATVKTQVTITSVSTTVTGTCATPSGAGTIAGAGSGTGSGNGEGHLE